MNTILLFLLVSIGLNLVMFVPAYILGTDKLTDISYSVTFLIVASVAYFKSAHSFAQELLLVAVSAWAIRLGVFLLGRVIIKGKDRRFDEMRSSILKFGQFWFLQGLTVFVVLLASIFYWNTANTKVTALSIIGLVVFVSGLLLEAIADQQKREFGKDKKNAGKWIASGVWSRSRHPNYLGEMMVWSGLYLYVLPSLSTRHAVIGLVSPLYIIVLLLFASGIPILEKSADAKWGKDKAYQEYKRRVPVLIPRKFL